MTLARRTVALLAALAAAALAACAHPKSLAGIPGGRPGWVLYHVEELWFRAPRDWHATGDLRHASVQEPDARSKLEITVPEQRNAGSPAMSMTMSTTAGWELPSSEP